MPSFEKFLQRYQLGHLSIFPNLHSRLHQSQNKRKPFRCQATTVSALTMIKADFQSVHTHRSQTQKIRSADVSFRRLGADRCKTPSCCRKARFSSRSWAELLHREARAPTMVNRRCRADYTSQSKSIN